MYERRNVIPPEIVDITSPGYNARLGRYFIGQTETLSFGDNSLAWSGIINPNNSGVNLYFDIFTITNFSDVYYTSEIWLNAAVPQKATMSPTITSSNQSVYPLPKPKALMMQVDNLTDYPEEGINIFDRIVPPNSTLVSDSHQGSIIIGPGHSFSILLVPQERKMIPATIVLTWWEESI